MYSGNVLSDKKTEQIERKIRGLRNELAHAKAYERPDSVSMNLSEGILTSPSRASLIVQMELDDAEKQLRDRKMFGSGGQKPIL